MASPNKAAQKDNEGSAGNAPAKEHSLQKSKRVCKTEFVKMSQQLELNSAQKV